MSVRSLLVSLSRPLSGLTRFKHEHALMVGGGVALLLGGLSALAMALAPMAPDIERLPPRLVTESVQALDIAQQLESLAGQPAELSRTLVLRGPDTIGAVLRRTGVLDAAAASQLGQARSTAQPEMDAAMMWARPRMTAPRMIASAVF